MAVYKVVDGYSNATYLIESDTVGLTDNQLKFFRVIDGVEDRMELVALFKDWSNFTKVEE